MEGHPPPVDLRAVCYIVSNDNNDNENEEQTQDNIKIEKRQTLVRAIDIEVCANVGGVVVGVCLRRGEGRKDGKESSTPENSTNKMFQVLTLQKAHEPPESERF